MAVEGKLSEEQLVKRVFIYFCFNRRVILLFSKNFEHQLTQRDVFRLISKIEGLFCNYYKHKGKIRFLAKWDYFRIFLFYYKFSIFLFTNLVSFLGTVSFFLFIVGSFPRSHALTLCPTNPLH